MKQLATALDKEGDCFKYLGQKFPKLSDENVRSGIFDGPQIKALFNVNNFCSTMKRNLKHGMHLLMLRQTSSGQ